MPTLALGGQLKATFALGRGRHAFLSHHIGDLDHYEASRSYAEAIAHYEQLFDCSAEILVHDLHPDYASTRYALNNAESRSTMGVQHHHAHMASCMAENGLDEPVIGVTFDGTGFGTDGAIWGGEFLIGDYRTFRRAAHLRPVRMPGGEEAIREPWRMAAAYLVDAGLGLTSAEVFGPPEARSAVERMLERGFNAPYTTSAGRLFDAVAALAGVRHQVSYEGQAAIELEAISSRVAPDSHYPFADQGTRRPLRFRCPTRSRHAADDRRVVDEVRRGTDSAVIGRRFHSTVVELIAGLQPASRSDRA